MILSGKKSYLHCVIKCESVLDIYRVRSCRNCPPSQVLASILSKLEGICGYLYTDIRNKTIEIDLKIVALGWLLFDWQCVEMWKFHTDIWAGSISWKFRVLGQPLATVRRTFAPGSPVCSLACLILQHNSSACVPVFLLWHPWSPEIWTLLQTHLSYYFT